jgi:uncharacterized protein HemX
VPFVIYAGVTLLYFRDLASLEKMAAVLGGYVATVLVYYFGQKQTQLLSEQVKNVEGQRDRFKENYEEASSDAVEASGAEELLAETEEKIANLKRELGIE